MPELFAIVAVACLLSAGAVQFARRALPPDDPATGCLGYGAVTLLAISTIAGLITGLLALSALLHTF